MWAGGHGRGAGAGEDSIVIMIMNLVTNILGFMIYSQLEYITSYRGIRDVWLTFYQIGKVLQFKQTVQIKWGVIGIKRRAIRV